MKFGYFKASEFGDCYLKISNGLVDYNNIISLTPKGIALISSRNFKGFFREGKISKKDFEELETAAKKRDRIKGICLIKKIYEDNPSLNKGNYYEFGDWYCEENRKIVTREIYETSKPILE